VNYAPNVTLLPPPCLQAIQNYTYTLKYTITNVTGYVVRKRTVILFISKTRGFSAIRGQITTGPSCDAVIMYLVMRLGSDHRGISIYLLTYIYIYHPTGAILGDQLLTHADPQPAHQKYVQIEMLTIYQE
jgi:hypothetical protein